jgi:hypothetical protein
MKIEGSQTTNFIILAAMLGTVMTITLEHVDQLLSNDSVNHAR